MDLTDIEKRIILALAECDMNVTATTRKVYMHRNTLVYNLEKIRKKTGLNPKKFFDLAKLLGMAKAETGGNDDARRIEASKRD